MKKDRSKPKKLALSKETVRSLSRVQLRQVAGADSETCTDRCTDTCTNTCTGEICTYGPTAQCCVSC
jgi:hypothetical protein